MVSSEGRAFRGGKFLARKDRKEDARGAGRGGKNERSQSVRRTDRPGRAAASAVRAAVATGLATAGGCRGRRRVYATSRVALELSYSTYGI